ncbi:MAG: hypothetical protein IPG93_14885 [Burkholderiales bacterium]|nr:hypothetical protein [Burkholderiales bacterium]
MKLVTQLHHDGAGLRIQAGVKDWLSKFGAIGVKSCAAQAGPEGHRQAPGCVQETGPSSRDAPNKRQTSLTITP